jgi:hypothetical protein
LHDQAGQCRPAAAHSTNIGPGVGPVLQRQQRHLVSVALFDKVIKDDIYTLTTFENVDDTLPGDPADEHR